MLDICTQFKLDTGKTIKEVANQAGVSVIWLRDMITGKLPYNERLERKLNHISKDTGISLDLLLSYAKQNVKVKDEVLNLIGYKREKVKNNNTHTSLKTLWEKVNILQNQVQAIIGE